VIVEARLESKIAATRVKSIDGHQIVVYGKHEIETHAYDKRGISDYVEQKFLATDIKEYDMILGFPWLKHVNPEINWKTGEWFYRRVPVEGIREDSAEEFLQEAAKVGHIMVAYVSPADSMSGNTQCSFVGGAVGSTPALPPKYQEFEDVFSEEGAAALPRDARVEHRIEIEAGKQVPFGPIYPLSQKELGTLREYIDTNLATGRIRASLSPAGAPILFVVKPDGSMRLCVDYRGLNKITVKNRYPLPLLAEILDRLGGACVFTKLDLRDAYHRIPIAKEDIWKTAFRTRYGHFEYAVMPFGLTNAPATFQASVNEALRGLLDQCCIAYMDDILIFSKVGEDHAAHVRAVLERLREYRLYAKLSKCDFDIDEVAFLGFRVGVAGVSMDPRKVLAIREWPKPQSFRDIQIFLGFANFYRGFIIGYSRVVSPITDLLIGMQGGKKTGRFEWTAGAEQAFHQLKACFMDAPMLQHFDPARRSRVETDACKEAAGGILSQGYESPAGRTVWRPVAFFSKKFQKEQRNYSTGDQEMLAIVMAFKEWRHYLDSPAHRTIVMTDHEALQSFMTTKNLQGRQVRWAEYLAVFDFEIQYRKGKDNPADGLLRRPDHIIRTEEDEYPLKKLITSRVYSADKSYALRRRESRDSEGRVVTVITRRITRDAVSSIIPN
jgi:RNase H-like domain found in reverse transcriptase/Reverse transcriptase (RNA-dependent DNA polymerase)